VNKDYDWHGASSLGRWMVPSLADGKWYRTNDWGSTWQLVSADGAWPREAECPAGWDERDALV